MNTQEALDAICEELDERLDRIEGRYSSCVDIHEAIETLRKAMAGKRWSDGHKEIQS